MDKIADKDMIRGYGGDIKYSYTIISAIAAKVMGCTNELLLLTYKEIMYRLNLPE